MTNKQAQITINAIKFMLDHAQYSEDVEEALNMAINALTAQPETHDKRTETRECDCVSRQAAIDICNNAIDLWHGQLGEGIVIAIKKKIEELPSAQPVAKDINVPVKDCISRQAAIDYFVTGVSFPDEDGNPIEDSDELRKIWTKCFDGIPSAQPDLSSYSDKLWHNAYNRGRAEAQAEIVKCKDCKWKQGSECVRFAEIRPFPDDFCSRAERRTDEAD